MSEHDACWCERCAELRLQGQSSEGVVHCTCEWAHPVDGSVRNDWPAELDPKCGVHMNGPEPSEGVEVEIENHENEDQGLYTLVLPRHAVPDGRYRLVGPIDERP